MYVPCICKLAPCVALPHRLPPPPRAVQVSLRVLLRLLRIPATKLHNGGNDAFYTMQVQLQERGAHPRTAGRVYVRVRACMHMRACMPPCSLCGPCQMLSDTPSFPFHHAAQLDSLPTTAPAALNRSAPMAGLAGALWPAHWREACRARGAAGTAVSCSLRMSGCAVLLAAANTGRGWGA